MPTRCATSRSVTPSSPRFENRYSAASRICSRLSARCCAFVRRWRLGAFGTYLAFCRQRSSGRRNRLTGCFTRTEFPICVVTAQLVLIYLARGGKRHNIDLEDLIGKPPTGYFAAQKFEELAGVERNPLTRLYDQNGSLTPRSIRPRNHRRETHGWMRPRDIFNLCRVYPFAARLDQVFRAPVDRYVAGLIDAGQIARIEEPKRVQGACAGIEIAFDNAGTLDLQM